jgi:hypothetical protein
MGEDITNQEMHGLTSGTIGCSLKG